MRLPIPPETQEAVVSMVHSLCKEMGVDPEETPVSVYITPIRVCDICQDRAQEVFPVYTGEIDHLCMDCWDKYHPELCGMCLEKPCACVECEACDGMGYLDRELTQACAACESQDYLF